MKIIQQLLVISTSFGILSPIAFSAELNISNQSDLVVDTKSINHFSDIHPSDSVYQALNNLRERHRCDVDSPSGSITRYEAAELLNQCLESIAKFNDEERLLIDELRIELAVIKGRVDVLENNFEVFEN